MTHWSCQAWDARHKGDSSEVMLKKGNGDETSPKSSGSMNSDERRTVMSRWTAGGLGSAWWTVEEPWKHTVDGGGPWECMVDSRGPWGHVVNNREEGSFLGASEGGAGSGLAQGRQGETRDRAAFSSESWLHPGNLGIFLSRSPARLLTDPTCLRQYSLQMTLWLVLGNPGGAKPAVDHT